MTKEKSTSSKCLDNMSALLTDSVLFATECTRVKKYVSSHVQKSTEYLSMDRNTNTYIKPQNFAARSHGYCSFCTLTELRKKNLIYLRFEFRFWDKSLISRRSQIYAYRMNYVSSYSGTFYYKYGSLLRRKEFYGRIFKLEFR